MNSNKSIGNKFEQLLLSWLGEHGYWCHLFADNVYGQPCDIIAVKNGKTVLIDVKHCVNNRFSFSRIEPNQETCMKYAQKKGGITQTGFAIYFDKEKKFLWLSSSEIDKSTRKSVASEELLPVENCL